MENVLEMWHSLPTAGKWAIGLGAVGIVVWIWKAKGSSPQTTANGQWVVQPDPNAGIPMGTPLGGIDYGQSGSGGSGQDASGGTNPVTGFGGLPGGSTPAPVTGSDSGSVTQPSGSAYQSMQTVHAINAFTASIPNTVSRNSQQFSDLHAQKVAAVNSLGMGMTTDSWGIVRNNNGTINSDLSAKFQSAGGINQYVNDNKTSLTSADYSLLHSQKVALETSLGNTVTADGHVIDKAGHSVGVNGMG